MGNKPTNFQQKVLWDMAEQNDQGFKYIPLNQRRINASDQLCEMGLAVGDISSNFLTYPKKAYKVTPEGLAHLGRVK